MIKNKKAQESQPEAKTLVLVIFILISLVIIISLIFEGGKVFWGITNKDTCRWEFLTQGISNTASMGSFVTNPECKMRNLTIKLEDLEKEKARVKKIIKEYKRVYKKEIPFNEDNEDDLLEFALYEEIGKEIRTSWDDVWHGNLPFLEQWWFLYPCGDQLGCKTKEEALNNMLGFDYKSLESYGAVASYSIIKNVLKIGPLQALKYIELIRSVYALTSEKNVKTIPCVARSKITFDKSVRDKFGAKEFTKFIDWMKINTVPKDIKKRNYLNYFGESIIDNKKPFNEVSNFNLNKDYAILYQRNNTNIISKAIISALRAALGDTIVNLAITKIDEESLKERDYLYLTEFKYENFRNAVKCHTLIA